MVRKLMAFGLGDALFFGFTLDKAADPLTEEPISNRYTQSDGRIAHLNGVYKVNFLNGEMTTFPQSLPVMSGRSFGFLTEESTSNAYFDDFLIVNEI